MPLETWRDGVPPSPRGAHGTHECDVHQFPEGADGLAVVPAPVVHPLPDELDGGLGPVHLQGWHVQVVDEEHKAFAQGGTEDTFTSEGQKDMHFNYVCMARILHCKY